MEEKSCLNNVKLSIKSLKDKKIREIDFNGLESYVQPFSMSESLTDIANHINFLADDKEEEKIDEDFLAKLRAPREKMLNHMKQALVEQNVLCDVIAMTLNREVGSQPPPIGQVNQQRYLFVDQAKKEPELERKSFQLKAKKIALSETSKILFDGAKKLDKIRSQKNNIKDYHRQLLNLRKSWRLWRHGSSIRGDLSFKTTGSLYGYPGVFDVVKTTDDLQGGDNKLKLPLSINIRPDLSGISSIKVSLKFHDHPEKYVFSSHMLADYPQQVGFDWNSKLCMAQNVIFCKELFARLSNEAIRYKSDGTIGPFVVIKDSISAQIFPNISLVIEYVNTKENKLTDGNNIVNNKIKLDSKLYYIKSLLMKKLYKDHFNCLHISAPKPTCAVFGLTNEQRLATVFPTNYKNLLRNVDKTSGSLVQYIVNLAKLEVVKANIREGKEMIEHAFEDKKVFFETDACVQTERQLVYKIYINESINDERHKTVAQMIAFPNRIKGVFQAREIIFEPDSKGVANFLLKCIKFHHTENVKLIANSFNWKVDRKSPFSGVDHVCAEHGSVSLSCCFAECWLIVKYFCSATEGLCYQILVKYAEDISETFELINYDSSPTEFDKASKSKGSWKTINCDAISGCSKFSQKLERVLFLLNIKIRK